MSASVNKAVMYSENSIPHLFNSIDQSGIFNGADGRVSGNYNDNSNPNLESQTVFRNSR